MKSGSPEALGFADTGPREAVRKSSCHRHRRSTAKGIAGFQTTTPCIGPNIGTTPEAATALPQSYVMVILLPGMDGTGTLFESFLRCLPAGIDTKTMQYPGEVHLGYEQLEERVARRLPVDRKYIIVAESFSGPIALRLAARPGIDQNLKAVVLVSTFAYRPLGPAGSLVAGLPLKMILRIPIPDIALRALLLGTGASAESVRRTREAIGNVRPYVLAARLREALTSRYCQAVIKSKVRVVAFIAADDRLLGRNASRSIIEVCSTAEVQTVRAPHFRIAGLSSNDAQRAIQVERVAPATTIRISAELRQFGTLNRTLK
jgi:pimeloyl-[acyl-carrier protein] methyl ester esterase